MALAKHEALYTCDNCECTVLSTRGDLTGKWRWHFHEGQCHDGKWTLILCAECEPKEAG